MGFERFDEGTYAILLGKLNFVTFDDEIHNKSVLMKRLNGRRPVSLVCVSLFLGRFINITRFKYPIIPNKIQIVFNGRESITFDNFIQWIIIHPIYPPIL